VLKLCMKGVYVPFLLVAATIILLAPETRMVSVEPIFGAFDNMSIVSEIRCWDKE
jgi:hypothetical protein